MFKYLIADYILGYCLSTDYPFSSKEIGTELHVPVESVNRIIRELVKLKRHWFDIQHGTGPDDYTIMRKKEYDDEMIIWLTRGESRNYYKLSELSLKGENFNRRTVKQRLVFTIAILAATLKFCFILAIRHYKKNRERLLKYIVTLTSKSRKAKNTVKQEQ